MNKIELLSKQIPFWKMLKENEKKIIIESCIIKKFKKGSIIHTGENDCLGLLIVLDGVIRVNVLSEDGREITLYKIKNNQCCVLSASCIISQITFDTEIVVEKDCEVIILNPSIFSKIMEDNILIRCHIYELIIERFSEVMWIMQEILFLKMDKRIALFLVNKYNETGSLTIKITHEQVGKELGTAREVVTRMLKKFETDGLVELKRGYIEIKDIEKLYFNVT